MIYYTADLHLGHANVIRHDGRPFASAEEMDRILMENWNRRVTEWNGYYRGYYHIYGHIHGNRNRAYEVMRQEPRALNAGCMINRYQPVTFEELVANNRSFTDREKVTVHSVTSNERKT